MKTPKTETIKFQGVEREYGVWPSDCFGDADVPRWWIMYNKETGDVSISDEVRQDYRPHMVFHELYEAESDASGKRPCVEALVAELARVSDGELERYVPFRKNVFEELVDWAHRNEKDIEAGARESLGYLGRIKNGND